MSNPIIFSRVERFAFFSSNRNKCGGTTYNVVSVTQRFLASEEMDWPSGAQRDCNQLWLLSRDGRPVFLCLPQRTRVIRGECGLLYKLVLYTRPKNQKLRC